MILTTDALVGGTITLALVASTTPLIIGAANEMTDIRRDLLAETVAARCTIKAIKGEDMKAREIRGLVKREDIKTRGTCGASGEELGIFWEKDQRIVKLDPKSGAYTF